MRTLIPPTIVEKNRRTGASFTRILQIHWDGPDEDPVYYGDADGTLPGDVPVLGRVRTWGPLSLQAEPGRIGGHQQIQIELQDPHHSLLTRMKGDFVDKRLVRIFLWFHGTSWATDKVCLFAGTINGNIAYNDTQATWQFSVKGAESLYDKTLGIEINRKSFPQILCNQCSGQIIPIVFGANVRRIPCCPLGRPPATMLTRQLNILNELMFLSRSIADMGLEFLHHVEGFAAELLVGVADLPFQNVPRQVVVLAEEPDFPLIRQPHPQGRPLLNRALNVGQDRGFAEPVRVVGDVMRPEIDEQRLNVLGGSPHPHPGQTTGGVRHFPVDRRGHLASPAPLTHQPSDQMFPVRRSLLQDLELVVSQSVRPQFDQRIPRVFIAFPGLSECHPDQIPHPDFRLRMSLPPPGDHLPFVIPDEEPLRVRPHPPREDQNETAADPQDQRSSANRLRFRDVAGHRLGEPHSRGGLRS